MNYLELISVQSRLLKIGISMFSVRDFSRIFKVLPKTAKAFLSYHAKRGVFTRVIKGVYLFNLNTPTKYEIANYLVKPSYISFETALSYYNVIPETVYSIVSVTTRPPREFEIQGQSFQYHKLKKKLYFGYEPVKSRGKLILLADKEKALLDYLYFLSLKKGKFSERLDLRKINKKKFGVYVGYFQKNIRKNKALINLVKKIRL